MTSDLTELHPASEMRLTWYTTLDQRFLCPGRSDCGVRPGLKCWTIYYPALRSWKSQLITFCVLLFPHVWNEENSPPQGTAMNTRLRTVLGMKCYVSISHYFHWNQANLSSSPKKDKNWGVEKVFGGLSCILKSQFGFSLYFYLNCIIYSRWKHFLQNILGRCKSNCGLNS